MFVMPSTAQSIPSSSMNTNVPLSASASSQPSNLMMLPPNTAQAILNMISQGTNAAHHQLMLNNNFAPPQPHLASLLPSNMPTPKDLQMALHELNQCFLNAKPETALTPPVPPLLRNRQDQQRTMQQQQHLQPNTLIQAPTHQTTLHSAAASSSVPFNHQQTSIPARKGVWCKMHWTIAAAIARHKLHNNNNTANANNNNYSASKSPNQAVPFQQQQNNQQASKRKVNEATLQRPVVPLFASAAAAAGRTHQTPSSGSQQQQQQEFSNAVLAAAAALLHQSQGNLNFLNLAAQSNAMPHPAAANLAAAHPFWANAALLAAAGQNAAAMAAAGSGMMHTVTKRPSPSSASSCTVKRKRRNNRSESPTVSNNSPAAVLKCSPPTASSLVNTASPAGSTINARQCSSANSSTATAAPNDTGAKKSAAL